MRRCGLALIVLLVAPAPLVAQSVTLGGAAAVPSAEDFATRAFQDPWDMNDRTDFGWFLYGTDEPASNLTNVTLSGGVFSATTTGVPFLFLLETGNPVAARLGKTGFNHPIDASAYRLVAVRMNVSGATSAQFSWNRTHLWDGTASGSNFFTVTPGWRTYLLDIPTLGSSGPAAWTGTVGSLAFRPAFPAPGVNLTVQIDWIRLVTPSQSLCRQVTWSGFGGAVDLYLDPDGSTNGNESLLAPSVTSNMASHGCTGTGSGYNFFAGALGPGTYQVLARPAGGGGAFTRSAGTYQVNAAPTLTVTSPSEEGSNDDFATNQLGNAWDMNAVSDVDQFFDVTSPEIATIAAETPGGASLGNVSVLRGVSAQASSVGDPVLALLWQRGASVRIDPLRYRILTIDFGLPNKPRDLHPSTGGSVARIVWRVVGSTDSVSDDIIIDSRAGANVMQKLIVDMADRSVLPIDQGSTIGWVPGGSGAGIDRFRFDVHEFANPTAFFVRRVKLAALERVPPGGNYTVRWTSSKPTGTVSVYRDTDRNPFNGGRVLIGTAPVSSVNGSMVWTTPSVGSPTPYFISVDFNDGANVNIAYSRWPVVVDPGAFTLSTPANLRVVK